VPNPELTRDALGPTSSTENVLTRTTAMLSIETGQLLIAMGTAGGPALRYAPTAARQLGWVL
jgi:hypothetical protein